MSVVVKVVDQGIITNPCLRDHVTCSQSCRTAYNRRFWSELEGRGQKNVCHVVSPNSVLRRRNRTRACSEYFSSFFNMRKQDKLGKSWACYLQSKLSDRVSSSSLGWIRWSMVRKWVSCALVQLCNALKKLNENVHWAIQGDSKSFRTSTVFETVLAMMQRKAMMLMQCLPGTFFVLFLFCPLYVWRLSKDL